MVSEMVQWLGYFALTEVVGVRFPVSEEVTLQSIDSWTRVEVFVTQRRRRRRRGCKKSDKKALTPVRIELTTFCAHEM